MATKKKTTIIREELNIAEEPSVEETVEIFVEELSIVPPTDPYKIKPWRQPVTPKEADTILRRLGFPQRRPPTDSKAVVKLTLLDLKKTFASQGWVLFPTLIDAFTKGNYVAELSRVTWTECLIELSMK